MLVLAWALAFVVLLTSCSSDLLGPEDPAYDEVCVLYVAPSTSVEITRGMFDRCETVQLWVVEFTDARRQS